jgi:hypothetical protein
VAKLERRIADLERLRDSLDAQLERERLDRQQERQWERGSTVAVNTGPNLVTPLAQRSSSDPVLRLVIDPELFGREVDKAVAEFEVRLRPKSDR